MQRTHHPSIQQRQDGDFGWDLFFKSEYCILVGSGGVGLSLAGAHLQPAASARENDRGLGGIMAC